MKHFLKIVVLITSAGVILAQGNSGNQSNGNQGYGGNQGNGWQNGWQGGPGWNNSPDLPTYSSAAGDCIVQYKTPPTKSELQALGPYGQIKKQYVHVNAVWASLTAAQIKTISQDPNVKYITPNRVTKRTLDITTVSVNANIAWGLGYTGTGIGVAVIDSGIYAHADLKNANGTGSRIVFSDSLVPGLNASDQYGHGTHVAGILGSNGNSSTGSGFTRTLKGVAPNVNLINLRVLDANGAGTDAAVIAAIDEAINLQSTYNIRVINLSLGRPAFESYQLDPLCQAVEAAWQAGIVVVAAAGNYGRDNSMDEHGYGTIVAPGNDPYVITVGAMNDMGTASRSDDVVASYSSKGPTAYDHIVKPDLVAPGNGTVSLMSPGSTLALTCTTCLVPNSYYQTNGAGTSGTYMRLSGTSMATPVVSGAVALLLQQNPSLTPDQVKARLMKSAQKLSSLYATAHDHLTFAPYSLQSDIFAVGAGYLDIQAALNNHDFTSLPALSASAILSTVNGVNQVTIKRNFASVWGSSVVWGDNVVYGTYVLAGLNSGGLSVLWGSSTIWGMDDGGGGFSVVWGDSLVLPDVIQALDSGDGDYSVVWGD